MLSTVLEILQQVDPEVHEKLSFLPQATFSISWVITWYAHDLPIQKAERVFDFMLSNHPKAIIALVVATILWKGPQLLLLEEYDMAGIHQVCKDLKGFQTEEILERA